MIRNIILVIYLCVVMLIFPGCDRIREGNTEDNKQNTKLDMYTLDLQDGVYFLMGMNYTLFQEILDNEAVDIYEQNSEERMSEHYYQLKNGVGVNISYGHIASVGTFYNDDSLEYMVPSLLGINGNDDYKSVIDKLGEPYNDDPNSTPPSVVYLVRYQTYVKIFFDSNTGKVMYISCFQQ